MKIFVAALVGLFMGVIGTLLFCNAKHDAKVNQLHTITGMLEASDVNTRYAIKIATWLDKGDLKSDENLAPEMDPVAVLVYAVNESLRAENAFSQPAEEKLLDNYPPWSPGSLHPKEQVLRNLYLLRPRVVPYLNAKPSAIGDRMWHDIMLWKSESADVTD